MTNAQNVFDTAMGLMDELREDGAADTVDTAEYKNRTLFILNLLRGELYPFSDTYQPVETGKRPIAALIENFTEAIDLDDYICQSILPYGLAAHLWMDENPTGASFLFQRYEELKAKLSTGLIAGSEDIVNIYGGIEYGEFSSW